MKKTMPKSGLNLYLVVGFRTGLPVEKDDAVCMVEATNYGQALRKAQRGDIYQGEKVTYPQFVFTPAEAETAFDRVELAIGH
jgi:hypothetical protein